MINQHKPENYSLFGSDVLLIFDTLQTGLFRYSVLYKLPTNRSVIAHHWTDGKDLKPKEPRDG